MKTAFEKRVWAEYIITRKISSAEQADEEYCKKLRGTFDFAFYRLYVAQTAMGTSLRNAIKSFKLLHIQLERMKKNDK